MLSLSVQQQDIMNFAILHWHGIWYLTDQLPKLLSQPKVEMYMYIHNINSPFYPPPLQGQLWTQMNLETFQFRIN